MSKTKNANPSKITIFKNEIYGIIILAFSFLLSYSLYFKSSGIAERYLKNFSMGLLGIGAFIVPVIIFLIGIGIIITKGKLQVKQRFIALCLLIFNILLIIQIKNSYLYKDYSFLLRMNKVYNDGLTAKGCGVLSELFNIPLIYFFSKTGSYIILICVCIIFALISTEASIQSFLSSIYKNTKAKNKKAKPTQTDALSTPKLCSENEVALDKTAYKQNIDKMDKKIQILDFLKNDNEKQLNNEDKPENNTSSSEKENNSPSEDTFNKIKLNKEANGNHLEYIFPQVELLNPGKTKSNMHDKKELLNNAKTLENTLESFGVEAKVIQVSRGPSVTRYELQPNPGVKVSRIVNLADDIALNLAAPSVRIEAPIPGKAAVGIELPNKEVMPVTLREVIESNEFKDFKSNLAFSLGKNISGKCVVADLSKMPHLLIAGATGSGKSVCINTLIVGLLYKSSPDDVKVLLIDPKVVELSVYNGIPHLLIPVVTDPKKAASALYWAVNEMNERYKLFADNNVRNIESYNELMLNESPEKKLPQIVIIIDELADLMMAAPNDVEDTICRLAQMARAAGMHLVIATQRPSVDVITGVIKANIPSRISFAVSSQIDSRTILDMSGAEKLLGRGDMLFLPIGESKPVRIQGAFISEKEVESIVEFLKNSSMAKYNDSIIEEIECKSSKAETTSEDDDELLPEAIKISVELGQISASMLQRKLRVGFNRASRLIEEMEVRGIVSAQDGSKPRQVLVSKEEYTNNMLNI